ncbi:MAG: hypothetical protein QOE76_3088, partial [Frankiales bacterium]|nr:hypothetical protein [Frankiales bacterium]
GVSSTVTVAATLFGSTGTSAAVTGAALLAGTAPLATSPARTLDGFSFQITNYVPSASYLVTASNGTLITSGSTISVYGLSPGAGSNVTVTVSRTGYTTASAVFSGAAMDLGVAPTFTVPTSTATGFSVGILNYSPSLVYNFSATNGAVVTSLGGTLVVSGLTPGDWSDLTVTATDPGLSAATATVGGSALLTGLTPVLGNPTRLVDGYSYDLTNFSLADSYALTVSGGSATQTGSTVTVTGLGPGTSATLTVTASRAGYTDASAAAADRALNAGAAPIFTVPTSTATGFSVGILNYSPSLVYSFAATNGAVVTDLGGTLVVSGLLPGGSSDILVTATDPGLSTAPAASTVTGSALLAGVPPLLSVPVPGLHGFTFQITDYSAGTDYTVTVGNGATVVVNGGTVTVSGLADSASAVVTVTARAPGSTDSVSTVEGTSLPTPVVPPTVTTSTSPAPATTGTSTPSPVPTPTRTGTPTAPPGVTHTLVPSRTPSSVPSSTGTGTAPVTTATTRAATSAPASPRTTSAASPAGRPADVSSGVTVDGVPVASTLTSARTRVLLSSNGVTMQLSATLAGAEVALTADGSVLVGAGGQLVVSVTGFRSGSSAQVSSSSSSALLDRLSIESAGAGTDSFALPSSMGPGRHVIVLSGTSAKGHRVTLKVSIMLAQPAVEAPVALAAATAPASAQPATIVLSTAVQPGNRQSGWWIVVAGTVAAFTGGFFLIGWRRRKEDEPEDGPEPGAVPAG